MALFGTGGKDTGVKVEKTGYPDGQNPPLVMMAGHQWPCFELVVWKVESRRPESSSGHDCRPSVSLIGTCGIGSGVNVEKTGHPGIQNLNLAMIAGPLWTCLIDMVV